MSTKSFSGFEVKADSEGTFKAVFSTFGVVDSDGDVTLPGAFEDGTEVRISAYGHSSWGDKLPVGRGVVRSTAKHAFVEGQFFLNTTAGRETYETVKAMGNLQEWSYSVEPTEYSFGEQDGRRVQFLSKLKGPHEVSPVLAGAGVGTRTLAIKSADPRPQAKTAFKPVVPLHETDVVTIPWDAHTVKAALPADASPSALRSIYAWVDPDGDPEAHGSYKFAHHHGVGGPANVRACMAGVAAINRDTAMSDADRKSAYEHLAAHLRDADREPPALRTQPGGPLKFSDELLDGLAVVSGLVDSAARVVALRAEKGKTLSKVNAELLDWIGTDLKRLQALLTTTPAGTVTDEELSSVVVAAMARLNDL